MKILQKILCSIAEKRGFLVLSEDTFTSIGNLLRRSSNKGVLKLVPYNPRMRHQSIFINADSMEESTLKTIENMIDETPVYCAKTYSRALRQIERLKFRKAKTIEEAKEYATKMLGIKSYDIPDIEVANQINLSMTNAIKKSKGMIKLPDKVEYASITTGDKKFTSLDCPAQTLWHENTNEIVLQINKDYFDNIDNAINNYLNRYKLSGQLAQNSKGKDCIKLITSYKYDNTFNRYYRLYKQGKLTTKAKIDFDNLLQKASYEEKALLASKDSLIDYLKQKRGIDLSHLTDEEYMAKARELLLDIRNKDKMVLSAKAFETQNAVGLDSHVLHELGHSTHFRKINFADYEKDVEGVFNPEEILTALKITPYATKNKGELIGEYIKGKLSGDKYSSDVDELFERCFKSSFQVYT